MDIYWRSLYIEDYRQAKLEDISPGSWLWMTKVKEKEKDTKPMDILQPQICQNINMCAFIKTGAIKKTKLDI